MNETLALTPLARWLRGRRVALGLRPSEVADRAGLSRSHYSALEKGKIALPSADVRRRLSEALGVAHGDLLVGAEELTPEELGRADVELSPRVARLVVVASELDERWLAVLVRTAETMRSAAAGELDAATPGVGADGSGRR